MAQAHPAKVYLVPLIDVNWANFAPSDPAKNYLHDAPPLEQCAVDVEQAVAMLKDLTDGKAVLTIHSGTYCRTGFYEEPFLSLYRRAVAQGAELAVHPHEEVAGVGGRLKEQEHVKGVIRERKADLIRAGLPATCYRGGLNAYMNYLTAVLEEEELLIDFSCAPGFNQPKWDAVWAGAPRSAWYLAAENYQRASAGPRSKVLEIPLGADGLGEAPINYLYTEESDDENLRRVWEAILTQADRAQRPQFVHILYHTSSMGIPKFRDRFASFMTYAASHQGVFVTPAEAKRLYDAELVSH